MSDYEKITIHLNNQKKLSFIGKYRNDRQTENWHYYETKKGKLYHIRKKSIVYVETKA